jgi:hypothetical protein
MRKKNPQMVLLFVMMLIITTHTILNINTVSATEITNVSSIRQEVLSKGELVGLATTKSTKQSIKSPSNRKKALKINPVALVFASALSPGITLLRVAYLLNENGANLEQWLVLFWILAIIDFFVDKIPGIALIFQFIQYPMVGMAAYLVVTNSESDSTIARLLVPLVAIIIQVIRQICSISFDTITVGFGTIPRSIFEDIVAIIIIFNFF